MARGLELVNMGLVLRVFSFCLTYADMGIYLVMARAATTLDAFNAVAEPRRREMLGVLGRGEMGVGEMVARLAWPQPQVSKHLGVLRRAGVVSVTKRGRERVYRVNGEQIKTIHQWAASFERLWENQLERIKERAEREVKEGKKS